MVLEWVALHQDELLADWHCCRDGKPVRPIEPLD